MLPAGGESGSGGGPMEPDIVRECVRGDVLEAEGDGFEEGGALGVDVGEIKGELCALEILLISGAMTGSLSSNTILERF